LLTNKQKNQLSKLYKNLDNPASYTSFTKLYKTLKDKYTKEQIIDFLKGENAYIYNKPTIRKFSRLKTYASAIDEIHQADIGFLQHLSDSNDGMSNLLFVIDVFSKYLWVRPLPNKKTLTVAKAYEDILKSSKRIPMRLHTDRGVEFFSRNMKQVLDKYKIKHYATFSGDTKASLAEVAIKTIKTRIYRYLHGNHTTRYIDALPKLINGYNNTEHSTHGFKPSQVEKKHTETIWHRLYQPIKAKTPRYKVGDTVLISELRGPFFKGYYGGWTKEPFIIRKIYSMAPPTYLLKDLKNENVDGVFYEQELQNIHPTGTYEIKKILKKKGKKYLVEWSNYPKPEWVSEWNLYINGRKATKAIISSLMNKQ
jgi:hypothetical protein